MEKIRKEFWIWTILFVCFWVSMNWHFIEIRRMKIYDVSELYDIMEKGGEYVCYMTIWGYLTMVIGLVPTLILLTLVCGFIHLRWILSWLQIVDKDMKLNRPEKVI